jgi:hypothetical protein
MSIELQGHNIIYDVYRRITHQSSIQLYEVGLTLGHWSLNIEQSELLILIQTDFSSLSRLPDLCKHSLTPHYDFHLPLRGDKP